MDSDHKHHTRKQSRYQCDEELLVLENNGLCIRLTPYLLAPFQVPQLPKNAENGNFSRLEYKSEPYADMEKFSKTQPLDKRKLGFG